jgi:hypothetical protein
MYRKKQKSANKEKHTSTLTTRRGASKSKGMSRDLKRLEEGQALMLARTGPDRPLPFLAIRKSKVTRRCIQTTALNFLPTIQDLWNLMGGVALTAILWVPAYWAFRLKKIEVWSSVVTQGTPVTASLQDVSIDSGENDNNGLPIKIVDESVSIDKPAHVFAKPVISTPMGQWHNGSARTNVATFLVACSANSVIEVTFEVVEPYVFQANAYTRAIIAGTPGVFSCLGLNGGTGSLVDGVTNF